MFDRNFYPANELETLPVVKTEAVATGNPQQVATKYPFCSKLRFERFLFFKVLENLYTRRVFPNSIPVSVECGTRSGYKGHAT